LKDVLSGDGIVMDNVFRLEAGLSNVKLSKDAASESNESEIEGERSMLILSIDGGVPHEECTDIDMGF